MNIDTPYITYSRYSSIQNNYFKNEQQDPLYLAAKENNTELIKLLLKQDHIDINKEYSDYFNQTIFSFACYNNNEEIVNLLLNDKRFEMSRKYPIFMHSITSSPNIIKLLLQDERIDVNSSIQCVYNYYDHGWYEEWYSKIRLANNWKEACNSYANHVWRFSTIGSTGGPGYMVYNSDAGKFQCYCYTCNGRSEYYHQKYSQNDFDIKAKEEVIEFYIDIVYNIRNYPSNFDIYIHEILGTNFFIKICKLGIINKIKLLLESERIDVNYKDDFGLTGLMWACGKGNYEVIKLLLNNEKVNINLKNKAEKTAIDILSKKNKSTMFEKYNIKNSIKNNVEFNIN